MTLEAGHALALVLPGVGQLWHLLLPAISNLFIAIYDLAADRDVENIEPDCGLQERQPLIAALIGKDAAGNHGGGSDAKHCAVPPEHHIPPNVAPPWNT